MPSLPTHRKNNNPITQVHPHRLPHSQSSILLLNSSINLKFSHPLHISLCLSNLPYIKSVRNSIFLISSTTFTRASCQVPPQRSISLEYNFYQHSPSEGSMTLYIFSWVSYCDGANKFGTLRYTCACAFLKNLMNLFPEG